MTKREIQIMRDQITELQAMSLQNAKLIEQLSIVIKGSDMLGVEGIHLRQKKDDNFKSRVEHELTTLKHSFNNIENKVTKLDNQLIPLNEKLERITLWKSSWDSVFNVITNSKFWAGLFVLGLIIAAIAILIKIKLGDLFG